MTCQNKRRHPARLSQTNGGRKDVCHPLCPKIKMEDRTLRGSVAAIGTGTCLRLMFLAIAVRDHRAVLSCQVQKDNACWRIPFVCFPTTPLKKREQHRAARICSPVPHAVHSSLLALTPLLSPSSSLPLSPSCGPLDSSCSLARAFDSSSLPAEPCGPGLRESLGARASLSVPTLSSVAASLPLARRPVVLPPLRNVLRSSCLYCRRWSRRRWQPNRPLAWEASASSPSHWPGPGLRWQPCRPPAVSSSLPYFRIALASELEVIRCRSSG